MIIWDDVEIDNWENYNNHFIFMVPKEFYAVKQDYGKDAELVNYLVSRVEITTKRLRNKNDFEYLFALYTPVLKETIEICKQEENYLKLALFLEHKSKHSKEIKIEALKTLYKLRLIAFASSDTVETVEETLKFAEYLLNNGATSCTFNAMVPFPGTYVYEKKEELGIKFIASQWEEYNFLNPVFETKGLNAEQLRRYLIEGLVLWGKYKNNRDAMQRRVRKRDLILLGDFLGRNVQT